MSRTLKLPKTVTAAVLIVIGIAQSTYASNLDMTTNRLLVLEPSLSHVEHTTFQGIPAIRLQHPLVSAGILIYDLQDNGSYLEFSYNASRPPLNPAADLMARMGSVFLSEPVALISDALLGAYRDATTRSKAAGNGAGCGGIGDLLEGYDLQACVDRVTGIINFRLVKVLIK